MKLKFFALLPLLLPLLAACAAPTTYSPQASMQEINAEAAEQEEYVKNEKAKGIVHGVYSSKPAGPRLQEVAHRIAPAAVDLCRQLGLVPDPRTCAYGIHIVRAEDGEAGALNAYADGEGIFITSRMVRFTEDDDELAFIIAHETAHNMMQHVASQKQNVLAGLLIGAVADALAASQGYGGGDTGFAETGAEIGALSYSPAFEQEADYIGLYLAARAGYDYHRAPKFWRRMSVENPNAIYVSTTHPSNAERYVVMRKDIAEIDAKKAAGQPLFPEFRKK